MNMFTRPAAAVAAAAAAALVLAGCSGGGGTTPTDGEYVDGATFTLSDVADPGALDPQLSAVSSLFQLTQFAYDALVSIDANGEIGSQLATEWNVDGQTVTLTLTEGVTCSDGADFTAETAAKNLTWISDPANQSPMLGSYYPPGTTATADDNVLTLELAAPSPFLLQGLASVPMVCDAGLEDRSILTSGTSGTGPYVLTEAVPNDHYTYEAREGYTWGPNGATIDEKGMPATVVARIVPNETTAANLLASGEINASTIVGPDAQRLDEAGLYSTSTEVLIGEQWYNQSDTHATSDPAVRMALTQALDLAELQKVLTSGTGAPATQLTVIAPAACTFDAAGGSTPATDVEAAKALLDDAGWVEGDDGIRAKDGQQLTLSFLYANTLGAGGTSAAELAVQQWEAIGVKVDAVQNDSTAITEAIFGTGAWDIAWVPVNVNNPDQMVGFLSGPAAPEGTNFASIQNADYEAAVAEAMTMTGVEGCDMWKAAEEALFGAADVVAFANNIVKTFGSAAEFERVGAIVPTSIRMITS